MMPRTFFEVDNAGTQRSSIRLDEIAGPEGASGIVVKHPSEPGKVLKIYRDGERSRFEEKVRAMVRVRYKRPHTGTYDLAWPESILVDEHRQFAGFKMPFFDNGWVDLDRLMQAKEAEEGFKIGDRQRFTIARNLSLAVARLHEIGTRVIDLKPDNIRVELASCAASLIDCDGMSVVDIAGSAKKRFPADKCTPEFWAPENAGRAPSSFVNEEAQDSFALATIIYMLLNRGLHPYQGVLAFEIPDAEDTAGKIRNRLYPYGAGRGRIFPHPNSLYEWMPVDLRKMFDRAFDGELSDRATAKEWAHLLDIVLSRARPCNVNPFHLQISDHGCAVCERDRVKAAHVTKPSTPPSRPMVVAGAPNVGNVSSLPGGKPQVAATKPANLLSRPPALPVSATGAALTSLSTGSLRAGSSQAQVAISPSALQKTAGASQPGAVRNSVPRFSVGSLLVDFLLLPAVVRWPLAIVLLLVVVRVAQIDWLALRGGHVELPNGSLWVHERFKARLTTSGQVMKLVFVEVKPGVRYVKPGDVIFEGVISGHRFEGKYFEYLGECAPIERKAEGDVDPAKIVIKTEVAKDWIDKAKCLTKVIDAGFELYREQTSVYDGRKSPDQPDVPPRSQEANRTPYCVTINNRRICE